MPGREAEHWGKSHFAFVLSPGWYSIIRSSNKNLCPSQGYVNEIFPVKFPLLVFIKAYVKFYGPYLFMQVDHGHG